VSERSLIRGRCALGGQCSLIWAEEMSTRRPGGGSGPRLGGVAAALARSKHIAAIEHRRLVGPRGSPVAGGHLPGNSTSTPHGSPPRTLPLTCWDRKERTAVRTQVECNEPLRGHFA
jgi:hypothetical protein